MKTINKSLRFAMCLPLIVLSITANAQVFTLTNDTVAVADSTGFVASPLISSSGIVSTVQGIPNPVADDPLNIPSFTFDLNGGDTLAAGVYTFTAGLVVDDDTSDRRVEISIPGITATVTANDVTGSLENTTGATGLARNGDSSISVALTGTPDASSVTFGLSSLSGGFSLTIDAAPQLDAFVGANQILADVIDDINTQVSGHYTYALFLKQTGGPELAFATSGGALPRIQTSCALNPNSQTTSQFLLNSSSLAATFDMAYALQGQFSFAGATSSFGPAPTAFTETCVAAASGGGTTPDPDVAEAEESLAAADEAIENLGDNPSSAAVSAAVTDLTDTAASIIALQDQGSTDDDLGLSFITSAAAATAPVSTSAGEDQEVAAADMSALLSSIGQISQGLGALSDAELETLNTNTVSSIDATTTLVATSEEPLSNEAVKTLVEAVTDVLTGSLSANNDQLETANKAALVALATAIDKRVEFSPATAKTATGEDGVLLTKEVADANPSINAEFSALEYVILSFPNVDFSALTTGTSSTTSDFANIAAGVDYAADVVELAIVSSSVAEGLFELSNGNIAVVGDNLSMTLSPASFDIAAFTNGITGANAELTLQPNGTLSITDGVIVVAATFGFENAEDAEASNSGTATFGGPTGADESDANYFFTVNYPNGATQTLQPLVSDNAFYGSVEGYGYSLSTDRATGIITIDGVGSFRPSYVVRPLTLFEGGTHELNKDASGVSYALTDANSDGVDDVLVFTDTSVQLVYGMP